MDPNISIELVIATCRSVEELRSSGGLPTEQADAVLAALKYCRSSCPTAIDDAPAESQDGNWDSLPDEIMGHVAKAMQDPKPTVGGYRSLGPWWKARLVSRSWNRAFSKHFESWDMTLCDPCHLDYEVDKLPPRFNGSYSRLHHGPNGEAVYKYYMKVGYRFTDRGMYGSYAKWLSERFPNLRHLSLPDFSGSLTSGPDCNCPACQFISYSSSDYIGITAILESLGAFKNLTSLKWECVPMLQDEHLEAISETLPKLECLILDCGDYDTDCLSEDRVSNEGFQALAKLTSLRKLHIGIADTEELDEFPITSAGPAFLTTLNQLTSLTCQCKMSPGDEAREDLKRISRMVQLRELDLLGAGCDVDMDHGTDDEDFWEDTEMKNKYLTPLKSLTNLCKLRLPVSRGWTRKGMETLLQKLPKVSDHNEWYYD